MWGSPCLETPSKLPTAPPSSVSAGGRGGGETGVGRLATLLKTTSTCTTGHKLLFAALNCWFGLTHRWSPICTTLWRVSLRAAAPFVFQFGHEC